MVLTMKGISLKYAPLAVFQIVLLILFFVFVRYGEPKGASGFGDIHVMIFIGFGFLMTFLKKYCYSALGFNWLLAAVVVQWAMICQNAFHMEKGKILVNKLAMVEADIMAATVLITMGALLGVASGLQLFFIAIVETVLGCANLYLVSHIFQAADAGGSIAIHTFGAYFGLGCSFAMKSRKPAAAADQPTSSPENESGDKSDGPTYISDVTAMIGSIFLWIYWPSFNSALVSTSGELERATMNTYLSLAAATVITFFMSSLISHNEGKLDMVHIQNSTLAGGVAIGSICNMKVSPGEAIAVGLLSGVISVLGYRFLTPKLTKIGINDTCGVNNLHGMPGLISGLLSILFAALATKESYLTELDSVFPAMKKGAGDRTASSQALYQLIALAATFGLALVSGVVTGFIVKLSIFKPLEEKDRYDDEVDWEVPA